MCDENRRHGLEMDRSKQQVHIQLSHERGLE